MSKIAITIPTSVHDVHLTRALIPVLQEFGPYPGHDLVLAPTIEFKQEAEDWKRDLAGTFSKITILPVDKEGAEGWPIGPNRHFKIVAKWMAKHGPEGGHFWWFEPDNCPVQDNWLQKVQEELLSSRKRFLGAVVPTRVYHLNTRTGAYDLPGAVGTHMVGAGIWPNNFAASSLMLVSVDIQRFDLGTDGRISPFDIVMGNETVPFCHPTRSIQHNWSTCNYRWDAQKGAILCDQTDAMPEYQRNGYVRSETLVVHGCKDDSLIRTVLEMRKGPVPEPAPAKLETAPGEFGPATTSAPLPVAAVPVTSSGGMSPLAKRIHDLMGDGLSRKSSRVAIDLQVPVEQVQAAIADPASGLKIVGPGWVKSSRELVPA